MKCTNCGNEVPETANVCGYCGHRLKSTPLPVESYTTPVSSQPSKNSAPQKTPWPGIWIFLTLFFGLTLVIVAAIQIFPKLLSSPSNPNNQAVATESQNNTVNPQQQSVSPEVTSDAAVIPATQIPNDLPLVEPCDITAACGQTYHIGFDELAQNYIPTGVMESPGSNTYSVTFRRDQTVSLWLLYCATTRDILEQNQQYFSYSLTVDGQSVDMSNLYKWEEDTGGICQRYLGLISNWTDTHHTVITTLTIDQAVNNGWIDRAAGDYTEIFYVTVTP